MAKKSSERFGGDNSLRAAVEKLFTQADNAYRAVSKAMENYNYLDDDAAANFTGRGPA